jgi:hypothetical protein
MPAEDEVSKARENSDREFARLWRAWRTVHQMVRDRVCASEQKVLQKD